MKRVVVCLYFIFSIYFQLFAQTQYFKREITWEKLKDISVSDSLLVKTLFFQNAFFSPKYRQLPLYYEKFQLQNNSSTASVSILNLVFVACSDSETQILSNLHFTNDSIIPETSKLLELKVPYVSITFVPLRKNSISGQFEKLVSFEIQITETDNLSKGTKGTSRTYVEHSVLASGNWYKMSLTNTGIYKITYSDLVNMGINVSNIDPRNIRIYGNGAGMLPELNNGFKYDDLQENAIYVEGESDGKFNPGDYILFYGEAPTTWNYSATDKRFHHTNNIYSDVTNYFITTDLGAGKRISLEPSVTAPSTDTVAKFTDYAFHESDLYNFIKSGRVWYGEVFNILNTYNFSYSFPNIDVSTKAYLNANVIARSGTTSQFSVSANGKIFNLYIGGVDLLNYNGVYAATSTGSFIFPLSSSDLNISCNYNLPDQSSSAWLNYFELNVTRNLIFSGNQMPFRNSDCVGSGNITDFQMSNASSSIKIWDVTNPLTIRSVGTMLNGSNLTFRLPTDSLKEFIAYNSASFYSPTFDGKVANQDLHGIKQCDFVIVSHPDFLNDANRLAQFHKTHDSLSTIVVTPQQIYNEFSSGMQDVSAIRDFLKMLYDRRSSLNPAPKYLLLFGDASYNYKGTVSNSNFVPTYESQESLDPESSYATDDYFGLLEDGDGVDDSGTLDIGIGRFPIQSAADAKAMVDKVFRYTARPSDNSGFNADPSTIKISNMADWKNIICFVADDEENNTFIAGAEDLAKYVNNTVKVFNIDKIYLDAFKQLSTSAGQRYPDVNIAINNRVERGALIINYTGHGGEEGWAHERVLGVSDINSWNNTYNMPVFITATCEFSRFDDPARISAGELVFLNPNGGGIALYTTSRLAFSSPNAYLNQSFYNYAFQKNNNKFYRMGDIMRHSKNDNLGLAIKNFVLLGDPALTMAYPEYNVKTSLINSDSVVNQPDTIKAFSKVTVSGYIEDESGNIKTDYNGMLYPTVFDKFTQYNTLGNDPASLPVQSFYLQNNILYKGKTKIKNGKFTFAFIVPKDISYKYGFGKISYYASSDSSNDANGYYNNIIIGGSLDNSVVDTSGPVIKLYMNDTLFRSGGITDQSPTLLAYIKDNSGINTIGNGIGHDIVAVLDGNTESSFVLNDFYSSDINSYTSGTIRYPFYNLSAGKHTLTVRVWDIYNNSSQAEIEFEVIQSDKLVISNIYNYPNPFSSDKKTRFRFEHNCLCNTLDAEIQIYNLCGQNVKTIKQTIIAEGYDSEDIQWDGTNDQGTKLANGIYIYRCKITSDKGTTASKSGKLIISN